MKKSIHLLFFSVQALAENPDNERAYIELALAADDYSQDTEAVLQLY